MSDCREHLLLATHQTFTIFASELRNICSKRNAHLRDKKVGNERFTHLVKNEYKCGIFGIRIPTAV